MKLTEIMKTNGMTVQQLSDVTGISKRTLELYTSGRRDLGNASGRTLIKIADALSVHPRDIIDMEKEIREK